MRRSVSVLAVLMMAGCGRYISPVPPEALAPKAVENLAVAPTATGITFSWSAAEQDQRGRELKSVDGYSIERKEIIKRGDETDSAVKFIEVGFVADLHIKKRDELRKEARAVGKVGRNVKSPPEFTKFVFTDSTPKQGVTYMYQIIPKNQGGVEGQVGRIVRVAFQGAQSAILMTSSKEIEDMAAQDTVPQ